MRERFEQLLARGKEVLATRRSPPPHGLGPDRVDQRLASGWAVSAQTAIDQVFGESSAYGTRFRNATTDPIRYSDALKAQGILEAARNELDTRTVVKEVEATVPAEAHSPPSRLPRFQLGILVGGGLGWFLCSRWAEIVATFSSADGIRTGTAVLCASVILGGIVCGNLFSSSVHDHGWAGAFRRAPVRSVIYLLVAAAGVVCTLKAASLF